MPSSPLTLLTIPPTNPLILSLIHVIIDLMPSQRPRTILDPISLNLFGILVNQLITDWIALGIFSVKNALIALTADEIVSLILPHAEMIAFRKSSFVFQSATMAVTSAATAVITIPMGFAFITRFRAACAIVAPSFAAWYACIALTTPEIMEATFHATNPAPIPATTEMMVSPLSRIVVTKSVIFWENLSQSTLFIHS